MFDFDRIAEMVRMAGAGLTQPEASAEFDPSALIGLDQAQIVDLLAQHGVDASFLDNLDLGALYEQLGQEGSVQSISDLISRVTER